MSLMSLSALSALLPGYGEVLIRKDQVEDARASGYLVERHFTPSGVEYRAATPAFVERLTARGVLHRYR